MSYIDDEFLAHHGILGMKWGIRRWQNKDGSLTSAGRRHYGVGEKMSTNDKTDSATTRKVKHDYNTLSDRDFMMKYKSSKNRYRKRVNKYGDPYMNSPLARYGKKKMAEAKEQRAKEEAKYPKQAEKTMKLEKKFNPKSKLQQKFYKQYRKKGYNEAEAKALAVKKQRATIAVGITAATTIAGIATYKKADKQIGAIFNKIRSVNAENFREAYNFAERRGEDAFRKHQAYKREAGSFAKNILGAQKAGFKGSVDDIKIGTDAYNNMRKYGDKAVKYGKEMKKLKKAYESKDAASYFIEGTAKGYNLPISQLNMGLAGAGSTYGSLKKSETAVKAQQKKNAESRARQYQKDHPETNLSYNELVKKAKKGQI